MKITWAGRLLSWFLRFLQIQLFLNLVALPILIAWGLPISLASPVGNLIFAPFLMAFLFFSSAIFFFELAYLPNQWLILILEKITSLWLYLLSWGKYHWLIGFKDFHWALLCLIPASSFFVLYCKKTRGVKTSIFCFIVIFSSLCIWQQLGKNPSFVEYIECHQATVAVIHTQKAICIIDPGVLGARASGESWFSYTLLPKLIQKTGKTEIDTLILCKPGKMLFETIEQIIEKVPIKTIYLTTWQGTFTKSTWHSFFSMKESIEKHDILFKRFGNKSLTINLANNNKIELTPGQTKKQYQEASYPTFNIEAHIDNNLHQLYSAK